MAQEKQTWCVFWKLNGFTCSALWEKKLGWKEFTNLAWLSIMVGIAVCIGLLGLTNRVPLVRKFSLFYIFFLTSLLLYKGHLFCCSLLKKWDKVWKLFKNLSCVYPILCQGNMRTTVAFVSLERVVVVSDLAAHLSRPSHYLRLY